MRVRNLVTSVTAVFDQFASRIENHEAVAEQVLADVRTAAARLKVQAGRVQADIDRRRKSHEEALQARDRWRTRALAQPEADKAQAIECLRRADRSHKAAEIASEQIARCEGLLREVQAAQSDVEKRLVELNYRKNALATRNARVEALTVSHDPILSEEIDAVFARWEHSVVEKEYFEAGDSEGQPATMTDRFEQDFDRAEADKALEEALNTLRTKASDES